MNPDLEKRIRTVYPTGLLDEPNRRRLHRAKFESAVREAVREIAAATSTVCDEFPGCWWEISRILQFDFILPGPSHEDWECRLDEAQRIAWLRDHRDVYAILTLQVSKVYPAYFFYFNTWRLAGPKDIDHDTYDGLADPCWAPFFQVLLRRFKSLGLIQLKEDERAEKIPFVRTEGCGDRSDEGKPILVPATVHQCLFEEV